MRFGAVVSDCQHINDSAVKHRAGGDSDTINVLARARRLAESRAWLRNAADHNCSAIKIVNGIALADGSDKLLLSATLELLQKDNLNGPELRHSRR